MPSFELASAVIALSVLSSLTGVEFCVAAFFHPVAARLPEPAAMAARALSAARLGAAMPAWYALAALTALLAAWGAVSPAATWMWSLMTAGLALIIAATILVLVPINSAIARGAREAGAAADAAEARRMRGDIARWDRLHRLRSLALAAAVVVEMVAVLV
ncbi:anthrone oxygenase family protein [Dietzia timorensis]|uniref:DUF1772 domain-containing protein n=2 Tax=Dietzia timorensis TaxID=499555 RepID=A0A173LHV2_9ACTN|nr:anthrone oxygenase family protein [Dietzia timorensis]ANI91906.1 Hypothetical protein BJL86_1115 [Dietzia timorensis]